MDVTRVLVILFVTVVAVYCKPLKDKTRLAEHVNFKTLESAITSLNQQVADFKVALQNKRTKAEALKKEVKKDESNSLEDSLKKAVAEDSVTKAKEAKKPVKDQAPPPVGPPKGEQPPPGGPPEDVPLEESDSVPGELNDSFFSDDADFFNEDFDEYEDPAKMDEMSHARKPKQDTPSKPVAHKTSSNPVKDEELPGEHLDNPKHKGQGTVGSNKPQPNKDIPSNSKVEIVYPELEVEMDTIDNVVEKEQPKTKKEIIHVSKIVSGIRSDIRSITKSFKEMKRDYADTMKKQPLDANTRMKFEAVKMDIDDVVDEFTQLKSQFTTGTGEVADESEAPVSEDDVKGMLVDMKDQLKDASDAIMELKRSARGRSVQTVATGVIKSMKAGTGVVRKKDTKVVAVPKKDTKSDTDQDMVRLDSLKEELRDVVHEMKDVKNNLRKEKANALKRDVKTKNDDKKHLKDIKQELDLIKDEVRSIKEKRTVV